MRFQALMPDVLHWLGVTKIDRFMSMSNMKYDAIVDAGIKVKHENTCYCVYRCLSHSVQVPWPYNSFVRVFFRLLNVAQFLTSCSHPTPRSKWMPRSLLVTSLQERFHAMKICARLSDVIGMLSMLNSLKAARRTIVSATVLDTSR